MQGAFVASDVARSIVDTAGYLGDDEPSGIGRLARDLFGEEALGFSADEQAEPAVLLEGELLVRRDLDPPTAALAIARCIARWALEARSIEARPWSVDAVAAALLVPPNALRVARATHGARLRALADDFVCPVWVMAMAVRGALARRRSLASLRLVAC